jgi:hypothetical protein
MLVELIEVFARTNYTNAPKRNYNLRKIYVNPKSVALIREEPTMINYLKEGVMPEGLSDSTTFTRLSLHDSGSTSSIVVVGTPQTINEKLSTQKGLLKG